MFGFEMHMAGYSQEASYLGKIENNSIVRFKNIVVIGNGDLFSFAKVGNKYWAIFQNGGHQTAMLMDEFGIGSVPCSTSNLSGYTMSESDIADAEVIQAVTFSELDADYWVKDEIIESLRTALKTLDKRTMGHNMMMSVSKEEYPSMMESMEQNIADMLESLD